LLGEEVENGVVAVVVVRRMAIAGDHGQRALMRHGGGLSVLASLKGSDIEVVVPRSGGGGGGGCGGYVGCRWISVRAGIPVLFGDKVSAPSRRI